MANAIEEVETIMNAFWRKFISLYGSLVMMLCAPEIVTGQSYGLNFNSFEVAPSKRSSLNLTSSGEFCIKKKLSFSFDLGFLPFHPTYFGYVFRLINEKNQNVDLIFDPIKRVFKIVAGNSLTVVNEKLVDSVLINGWTHFSFDIDASGRMDCNINGHWYKNFFNLQGSCFRLIFGINNLRRFEEQDIPPMRLKDIEVIVDNNEKYLWLLDESSGNTAKDKIRGKTALVVNPNWIAPRHNSWDNIKSFTVRGDAITAFDSGNDKLYIAGTDSVLVYDFKNISNPWSGVQYSKINFQRGSQGIFDILRNKIYDVFIDEKRISVFEPSDNKWSLSFDPHLTEYWHANKFISPLDSMLYIVGGYGQLKYKNGVYRVDPLKNAWDSLPSKGDFFAPRYLAALGLNTAGDTAYILGGYGSENGDQMINPHYFYELFAFSVKDHSFRRIMNVDSSLSSFAFANSLVIDSRKNTFYGLVFGKGHYEGQLQLVEGHLKQPGFKVMPATIPFSFLDIKSFVDFYYSPRSNKFIVVTMLFSDPTNIEDRKSEVKIYTLDFPPSFREELKQDGNESSVKPTRLLLFLAGILAIIGVSWVLTRKKSAQNEKKLITNEVPEPVLMEEKAHQSISDSDVLDEEELIEQPNYPRIALFGQFQVVDREGEDITEMFTPLLKELFLLIFVKTAITGRGVTADEIAEHLWMDKSSKDAKNNRAVNITKLKKILEKLAFNTIQRKAGLWVFIDEEQQIDIDFYHYEKMRKNNFQTTAAIGELMKVVGNGSFLQQSEYPWLDDTKAQVANNIIGICQNYYQHHKAELEKNPQLALKIADCIFYYDNLNEIALHIKSYGLIQLKRHASANKLYERFCKDYLHIYGESFDKSFASIIKKSE